MDTRLNGTVTALRLAIGLMATLAGLDKFFNLLTNWAAYVAPVAQQLLPFSISTFMAVVGVIEFAVGITILAVRPSVGAFVASAWLAARIEDRRTELARVSDQILDRRTESLRESHARWMNHRERLLAHAQANGQQPIARLHEGYMRRRQGEVDAKLVELERQKGVEIGYELVAGGLLEVASGA